MSVSVSVSDVLKAPMKVLMAIVVAVGIGTGIILFLPNSLAKKLYIDSFRNNYGFVIGIAFIISVSIVAVAVLFWSIPIISKKIKVKRRIKVGRKGLNNLNEYQMFLVYSLYREINHTGELPMIDGEVIRLEQVMVISKATTQYIIDDSSNPVWPYMLQPWVLDYLDSKSELVEKYKEAYERVESNLNGREIKRYGLY